MSGFSVLCFCSAGILGFFSARLFTAPVLSAFETFVFFDFPASIFLASFFFVFMVLALSTFFTEVCPIRSHGFRTSPCSAWAIPTPKTNVDVTNRANVFFTLFLTFLESFGPAAPFSGRLVMAKTICHAPLCSYNPSVVYARGYFCDVNHRFLMRRFPE